MKLGGHKYETCVCPNSALRKAYVLNDYHEEKYWCQMCLSCVSHQQRQRDRRDGKKWDPDKEER